MSDPGSALTLIAEGSEYELLGSPGGETFVLRFKTDQMTAHIAGDDASRFRLDYETLKQQYPAWAPDQTLAQLWDQGGYSWLAAQEG